MTDRVDPFGYPISRGERDYWCCDEVRYEYRIGPQVFPIREHRMWISVKDRLPEEGQEVLVWHEERKYWVVTYSRNCWSRGGWLFSRDCITHWQPLSSPPAPPEYLRWRREQRKAKEQEAWTDNPDGSLSTEHRRQATNE